MEGIKEVVMKRMLSLALVLLLALSLFAGCGGNNTQNNTQTGNQTTEGDGGADAGEAEREHVTIRFAQCGNNLDDAGGDENDPSGRPLRALSTLPWTMTPAPRAVTTAWRPSCTQARRRTGAP